MAGHWTTGFGTGRFGSNIHLNSWSSFWGQSQLRGLSSILSGFSGRPRLRLGLLLWGGGWEVVCLWNSVWMNQAWCVPSARSIGDAPSSHFCDIVIQFLEPTIFTGIEWETPGTTSWNQKPYIPDEALQRLEVRSHGLRVLAMQRPGCHESDPGLSHSLKLVLRDPLVKG